VAVNQRHTKANEPLRIALYSPALPDSGASNGIVTYTRIMRDALRALGHEVFVVTTEYMEDADGNVAALPKINRLLASAELRLAAMRGEGRGERWVRMNVRNAFAAARRLEAQVFEIEESFGWAGALNGQGVAIVERLHGPHAFVRNVVESAAERKAGDRREAAERSSFGRVQAMISPTRGLLDALVERFDLDLGLARVIPNPMPLTPPSAMWRYERANPTQLLAVGRFDLCKGADVMLRAFAVALNRQPDLTLVMAGPDTGLAQADGTMVRFDDFVRREIPPEARSRITFLGPQPPSRISELRLQSGVAVVASRFETFPYTIAEAMAVGMPILASATFGAREMIRDGVDGRIVPIADIEKTAEPMVEMAAMPEKLAEFGRSAHARAAELLSPERVARETVELYRQAIARLPS